MSTHRNTQPSRPLSLAGPEPRPGEIERKLAYRQLAEDALRGPDVNAFYDDLARRFGGSK